METVISLYNITASREGGSEAQPALLSFTNSCKRMCTTNELQVNEALIYRYQFHQMPRGVQDAGGKCTCKKFG